MINRALRVQKTHNAADRLNPDDPVYRQWIFRYTFLELEKDLGEKGDITSLSCFEKDFQVKAQVLAEQNGIVAGIQEVLFFLRESSKAFRPRVGGIRTKVLKNDGEFVKRGQIILSLQGSVFDVLAAERVVLNVLGRMSGIATLTLEWFQKLKKLKNAPLLCPTRKTLWGLLDKRACVLGGGGTHRLSLDDAVLIKDNHFFAGRNKTEKILKRAAQCAPTSARFFEVEVSSKRVAFEAAKSLAEFQEKGVLKIPGVLMFDNMSPDDISSVLAKLKKNGSYFRLLFEGSGGITKENVLRYARTGVDILSAGALTHSAPIFGCSMDVLP